MTLSFGAAEGFHNLSSSCGTEFGYDDVRQTVGQLRAAWGEIPVPVGGVPSIRFLPVAPRNSR